MSRIGWSQLQDFVLFLALYGNEPKDFNFGLCEIVKGVAQNNSKIINESLALGIVNFKQSSK